MSKPESFLVADIGGTNARFAVASGSARSGFTLSHICRLKNEDFEHLRDAASAYLQTYPGPKPQRACFAVAAPIAPGPIKLTNSTWRFDAAGLAPTIGLDELLLVNDFAAQARGAPLAPSEDVAVLNPGQAVPETPCAVLGPGTGLGLGLLIPHGGNILVVETEGGHAGFAPRTGQEVAVGKFIADEYGYVSWERLLSGRGLVNIHRALCAQAGLPWSGERPEDITASALADPASMCGRVVDLFCACLGAFAGDVAVLSGARSGVYLAGGILPRIRVLLENSPFLQRFSRRGPMTRYAEAIPVKLLLTDSAALLGAAAIAEKGRL